MATRNSVWVQDGPRRGLAVTLQPLQVGSNVGAD